MADSGDNCCSEGWWIYLVRTNQGHLYCGITKDVQRRFEQHSAGTGAKYLRGKGPLKLEWHYWVGEHSQALRCEYALKRLPRKEKERLISEPHYFQHIMSHCFAT